MSDTYNVQPAEINIHCLKGDTLDMKFEILLNNQEYTDLDEGELKMVVRDFKGTVKRTLISTGETPELSSSLQELRISGAGFDFSGTYKYDLQHTDGDSNIVTIMKGLVVINEEQTT